MNSSVMSSFIKMKRRDNPFFPHKRPLKSPQKEHWVSSPKSEYQWTPNIKQSSLSNYSKWFIPFIKSIKSKEESNWDSPNIKRVGPKVSSFVNTKSRLINYHLAVVCTILIFLETSYFGFGLTQIKETFVKRYLLIINFLGIYHPVQLYKLHEILGIGNRFDKYQ